MVVAVISPDISSSYKKDMIQEKDERDEGKNKSSSIPSILVVHIHLERQVNTIYCSEVVKIVHLDIPG